MIPYETARLIALYHIGPECGLIEKATREMPYGWYFADQSLAYLKSGDPLEMLYGSNGFIVDREDGHVFVFGSIRSVEADLANYEKGFKYERYDLVIRAVRDPVLTLDLLYQLEMKCVVPETAHGGTGTTPRQYKRDELAALLKNLPCVFVDQKFYFRVGVFDEIDRCRCCLYELQQHKPVE